MFSLELSANVQNGATPFHYDVQASILQTVKLMIKVDGHHSILPHRTEIEI